MEVSGSAADIWKSFPLIVKVNFKHLNKQQYRQRQKKYACLYSMIIYEVLIKENFNDGH